ncbi:MAG: alternative ribosome rescue aminoacyl-tRNA hydrolase ArfB [Pseudomonadota bacterium]
MIIKITQNIALHESELKFTFVASPGPGGQNVNKLATAVQLRFDVQQSTSFSEEVRQRLLSVLSSKLTTQGELIIKASRHRTQERNKQDAINRLVELLQRAAIPPKKRRKTKPSYASVQKRLSNKKMLGEKKARRRGGDD